jgi:hypothetical protein
MTPFARVRSLFDFGASLSLYTYIVEAINRPQSGTWSAMTAAVVMVMMSAITRRDGDQVSVIHGRNETCR